MEDKNKTKKQLINELVELRRRISDLENAKVKNKRKNNTLSESESSFREIIEHVPDPIFVHSMEGKFIDVNQLACDMLGYTREELLTLSVQDIEMTLEPEKFSEIWKYIALGIPVFIEGSARCKDGGTFPIEVVVGLRDRNGSKSMISLVHDITERKQAKEREASLGRILETSRNEIYIFDAETMKFIQVNRGARENLGYSMEELRKMTPLDLKPEYTPETFANLIEPLRSRKEDLIQFTTVHLRKDKSLYPVEVHLQRSTFKHIPVFVAIILDITERKKLEEQLLHAQKMEAVGQLAGGVAHDFNNILTAIIGYGHIMQMKMDNDDPSWPSLNKILSSAEKAAKLTHSLLAFGRKQIMQPKPICLNEAVRDIEKLLTRTIGEDIELSTELSENDLIILADYGQLEQVLMNLVTNARDAMPNGGRLTLQTSLIEIKSEFEQTGEYALLSVSDTGDGMDEETKEKIFEPFFSTKEVGKGTGLGLAIVYGIIKQHNGNIDVFSKLNGGTTFKLYLPLIKSEREEKKPEEFYVPDGGTETILVAEDDGSIRGLLNEVLSKSGYIVIEATDGEDAINKFMENKDKIQLLVFDVIMPKKSGKEAYDKIRKIKPDIRALFISGYTADMIQKKGILEEGLNFTYKPISPANLLRTIREILDK